MKILYFLVYCGLISVSFAVLNKSKKTSLLDGSNSIIDTLVEKLTQEQREHDLGFYKQLVQCKSEIKYRQQESSDAKFAYSRAIAEYNSCNQELQHSTLLNKKNSKIQLISQGSLAKIQGLQGLERDFSSKKLRIYENLLKTVSESPVESKSSLVELTNSIIKSQDKDLMSNFISLSKSSDKLDLLISAISSSVAEAKQERTTLFDDIDSHYKSLIKLMTQVNDSYQDSIAATHEFIANMEECIKQQENSKFIASDQELRSNNLLRDISILCKDWTDQYNELTANRDKEISLLSSLKSIASKRFSN